MAVCLGRLSALLILSCVPMLAQSTSTRATIQQSLGFEDQSGPSLRGWHSGQPDTVFADDKVVHSGHWSVRLQRDARSKGSVSAITRTLPVDFKGQRVELRGYLKLEHVTDFAGLWLREDADDQMLSLENMQSQQVKGTRDWAEYRIALPIDPRAQKIYFGVLSSGAGTLWADDLELLVDGKPIAEAPAAPIAVGLPVDHEFDSGSGVVLTDLASIQVSNLITLGRVWGFLKYHHPAITAGQRNWDYDLFRVLPKVLAARDREQANNVLLKWIDALGPVPACNPCVSAPAGDLDLKPELAWIRDRGALGASLSQRLESIYANRTGKQFFVSSTEGSGNARFDHELSYAALKFPDSGYQLLALFRWWNIMQYWAPDRAVAGQDWNAVLAEFIPRIALAKDKEAYQLALFELIAKANDTHANLWSSLAVRPPTGQCALPVVLRFLDGKAVVYRPDSGEKALKPGDIVNGIDGVTVSSLVEKDARYYADSNEAARQRDLAEYLSRGACGPVSIEIIRGGKTQEVSTARVQYNPLFATHDLPGQTFQLLSPDVAYIKLSSIKAVDVPSYFERAKNTKGLIVDIRNYPSAFMPFAMGSYLVVSPTPFVSFTMPDLANPGAFRFTSGPLIPLRSSHYNGKVVILVDESTQSQAEYTAMALRATPNAVVMGSTTAGADGNVSAIPLPGGLSTMISGLGVFYPDHRPTQRIGIVPDVIVRPTVKGIAEGRDELVEAAERLIEGSGEASPAYRPRVHGTENAVPIAPKQEKGFVAGVCGVAP
jgi:C-terminal processing protease CtpA/Prc